MHRIAGRIILTVIIFASLYAILRYHIFKGVEWQHFPLFIMNKILAFSGFLLLVLSVGLEPVYGKKGPEWFTMRKFLGRSGLVMIVMHILMSFLLFRPEVYDKFFSADGTLNAVGEWSMLLGTLGIAAYIIMHNTFANPEDGNRFQQWVRSPFYGILALLLSALHVGILGFSGWLTPRDWHGGMPSISLLSVAFFLIAMIILLAGKQVSKK
jgi:hypothetical protein